MAEEAVPAPTSSPPLLLLCANPRSRSQRHQLSALLALLPPALPCVALDAACWREGGAPDVGGAEVEALLVLIGPSEEPGPLTDFLAAHGEALQGAIACTVDPRCLLLPPSPLPLTIDRLV